MLGHPVDKKLAQKLSVNNSAFKLKKVNSMLRLIILKHFGKGISSTNVTNFENIHFVEDL